MAWNGVRSPFPFVFGRENVVCGQATRFDVPIEHHDVCAGFQPLFGSMGRGILKSRVTDVASRHVEWQACFFRAVFHRYGDTPTAAADIEHAQATSVLAFARPGDC